jgi:hypothetical protein
MQGGHGKTMTDRIASVVNILREKSIDVSFRTTLTKIVVTYV